MDIFGDYLLPFLKEKDFNFHLRDQEKTRNDVAPCVGPQTGRLLAFLIYTLNAKNVLEIGACQGYSALWLAEALQKTGGHLTTLDINEQTFPEAKANIAKAGFTNVTFLEQDALTILPSFETGSFDLILQDSAKGLYSEMLEDCIRLLRLGGILISDDILFKPLGKRASIADAIHNYNLKLTDEKRLYTTFLTIGDGVALSLKIKE